MRMKIFFWKAFLSFQLSQAPILRPLQCRKEVGRARPDQSETYSSQKKLMFRQKALAGEALEPRGSLMARLMSNGSLISSISEIPMSCSLNLSSTLTHPEKAAAFLGPLARHWISAPGAVSATANSNGDASS